VGGFVGGELSICVLSAEEQDLTQDLSTTHYHMLIPLNIFFLIIIFCSGNHSVYTKCYL